jgi:hypothetical protein
MPRPPEDNCYYFFFLATFFAFFLAGIEAPFWSPRGGLRRNNKENAARQEEIFICRAPRSLSASVLARHGTQFTALSGVRLVFAVGIHLRPWLCIPDSSLGLLVSDV